MYIKKKIFLFAKELVFSFVGVDHLRCAGGPVMCTLFTYTTV